MPKDSGIGASSKRREDVRFLTGAGNYTDDINISGQAYVHFLISNVAHGRIKHPDTSIAEKMPGVVRVFTSKDLSGIGGIPTGWQITDRNGGPMQEPKWPVLAEGKVRHVGDRVAAVVAETFELARSAAEVIKLELEDLPPVTDMSSAWADASSKVHDDLSSNLCLDSVVGSDHAAIEDAFSNTAPVTTAELTNKRLVDNPMEPGGAIGDYNRANDKGTLYTTSQNPHVIRLLVGAFVLGIQEHKLRVIAPDVGGGFRSKIYHHPEETFRTFAAKALQRPVKWTSSRSEAFFAKFPYATPVAVEYDTGNYVAMMDKLEEIPDLSGFAKRRAESEARGKLRELGVNCYIAACGIAPSNLVGQLGARAGLYESATVRVNATGGLLMITGSHSHGQRPETAFPQFVADMMGIEESMIEVVHGDTSNTPMGMGTYGSRSLAVGGSAMVWATEKIISKAKKIAAHLMEASESDIELKDGAFTVAGADKSVAWADVTLAAYVPHNYPSEDIEPGLEETAFYDPSKLTYPAGAYACEVEVDPDTGKASIEAFTAVDDFGNVVNPMIVTGQVHGGLAQGIGQALLENSAYDENGQLLSASYMDYAMLRADDLPMFAVDHSRQTPCTHNPLGVKGCGEAGAMGSPPALVNAVIDALHSGGKQMPHIDMPLTPSRVWVAMQ